VSTKTNKSFFVLCLLANRQSLKDLNSPDVRENLNLTDLGYPLPPFSTQKHKGNTQTDEFYKEGIRLVPFVYCRRDHERGRKAETSLALHDVKMDEKKWKLMAR